MDEVKSQSSIPQQNRESGHGKSGITLSTFEIGAARLWRAELTKASPWGHVLLVLHKAPSYDYRKAYVAKKEGVWAAALSFDVFEPTRVGIPDSGRTKVGDVKADRARVSMRDFAISPLTTVSSSDGDELEIPAIMPTLEEAPSYCSVLSSGNPPPSLFELCKPSAWDRAREELGYVMGQARQWKRPGWKYFLEPGKPARSHQENQRDARKAKALVESFRDFDKQEWSRQFASRIGIVPGTHQVVIDLSLIHI